MKGDEIKLRAGLSGHLVSLVRAMIEKIAQEFSSLRRTRAGGIRAADASIRQRSHYGIDRIVVSLEELLGSALPVRDVRLIPNFPPPGFTFRNATLSAT